MKTSTQMAAKNTKTKSKMPKTFVPGFHLGDFAWEPERGCMAKVLAIHADGEMIVQDLPQLNPNLSKRQCRQLILWIKHFMEGATR